MTARLKFTIYHGVAASLALHSAIGLPFVLPALFSSAEERSVLDLELQGAVSDVQTEEKSQQDKRGEAQNATKAVSDHPPVDATKTAASDPPPLDTVAEDKEPAAPAPVAPPQPTPEKKSTNAGSANISGGEEQEIPQRIKLDSAAKDRAYARRLAKKLQSRIHSDEGRKASATVFFVILSNGQLRPDSLKIVTSSGEPHLDASALKSVRASLPFDPPPREMALTIVLDFGPKR
jgi:protein TonB